MNDTHRHLSWPSLLTLIASGAWQAACGDSAASSVADAAADTIADTQTSPDVAEDVTSADVPTADLGPDTSALCPADDPDTVRPAHWTAATHCKGIDPDYDVLFDDTVVHQLALTVAPADWAAAQADLDTLLGNTGGGPGGGGPGNFDLAADPMWFPVTVALNGLVWEQVGMRFKGNSSLHSAYRQGKEKLSFRFNFDKFEDDHPTLQDQRFYGFKKMTFSNGFKDDSLIRDKLAADLFRAGGVPAARGAFAAVTIDTGDGPVYFGLYTMIEDPSDELLGVQFDDDGGTLYKPDGDAAAWTHFDADEFEKKTLEDESDWSDVEAAITALHADRGDAATWRAGLEATFDVDAFLRVLALNQAMVNWDSYGRMTHNYYVYGDPSDGGRLVWFPWDLNEAMLVSGPQSQTATSVMCDEIGDGWPLIRWLLDDAVYRPRYEGFLQDAIAGPLAADHVNTLIADYHALIAPWVVGPDGVESGVYTHLSNTAAFNASAAALQTFLAGRRAAVSEVLAP